MTTTAEVGESVGDTQGRLAPQLVPALALLIPVLNTPIFAVSPWAARYLVVLVLAGCSIPLLVAALRGRSPIPVAFAGAFLAWAAVATATSRNPQHAFWGSYAWGTGLVFVAALVGAWLLGGLADDQVRSRTTIAFLLGAALNAAIALAQVVFDLGRASLGLDEGRAYGLVGNPVYLAGLAVGALWLLLHSDMKARAAIPLAALFGAAAQVSGGRTSVILAAAGVAVGATVSWRRAAVLGLAIAVGLLAGSAMPDRGGDISATERLATTSSGIRPRLAAWGMATKAVAERPLTGAGPGRYQAATSKYTTLEFVRYEGVGKVYRDAHNIIVEYAVTTGIVGVLLLLGWLVFSFRLAGLRRPLAAAAFGMLLVHLLQPQSVVLTPMLFLLLGAQLGPLPMRWDLPGRIAMAVGLLAGASTAATIGYGLFAMNQATLDFKESWAEAADRALPPWSDVKEMRARVVVLHLLETRHRDRLAEALPFRRAAASTDDEDPFPMEDLAAFELQLGLVPQATQHLARVIEQQPYSPNSLTTLGNLLARSGRDREALALLRRSLEVEPKQPQTRALIRQLEAQSRD